MATTVVSTDRTTQVALANQDHYVLLPDVNHYVLGAYAINSNVASGAFSATVNILGTVYSDFDRTVSVSGLGETAITIGQTGTILAEGNSYGIYATSDDTQVTNQGSIISAQIRFLGDGTSVINSGTISGTFPTGDVPAIYLSGLDNVLLNSGLIDTTSQSIVVLAGTGTMINSGQMLGGLNGVRASTSANSELDFDNSGTLAVTGMAIRGADENDSVRNSGTIIGDIDLGDGDDTYRGIGDGILMGTLDAGRGDDLLVGGDVADEFHGGRNGDTLRGRDGNDDLFGDEQDDMIQGGAGNDLLDGGKHDDALRGGSGDDDLRGGDGQDDLRGGSGDDDITGGEGKDQMFGGSGQDVFIFTDTDDSTNDGNRDFIKDFKIGQDLIDITGLPGKFTFIGDTALTGTDEEVRATVNGAGNTTVYIDADADGTADMRIVLEGVSGISETDFLL